jgi:anti-sigma regulatory factor (Ser/Thr protein kinase)
MATVQLRFSALPAHVRTARLVAAAVARRSGVDEAILDEVRLAVGEACSRAVDLHRRHCPTEPVRISLIDGDGAFRVEVTDRAPVDESPVDVDSLATVADLEADTLPTGVGLAVISGLVEDFSVEHPDAGGMVVQMRWPAEAHQPGLTG